MLLHVYSFYQKNKVNQEFTVNQLNEATRPSGKQNGSHALHHMFRTIHAKS
jgi:hypothetical protein